ncbi:MAG: Crp/Fnr family transcriptional regulator, partial [Candidatus Saccharimonadales bacterium]
MPIKTDQMRLLVDFFHQGNRLTYTKGDFINRPGQALPGVFYIEEGLVKSYDITKYGEENLLIIRKKAELLGLTWAITGKERAIIYSVLAPTTAWLMSREKFTDFVQGNPGAALPVLDMVADMYRLHSERIMTLEYRTVRER